MHVFALGEELVFPNPRLARRDGLLAVGGDLSRERLLLAYRRGIFPWFSADEPILWWSPDPRLLLFPQKFHVSRSLARTLRRGRFILTMDQAFVRVMELSGKIRQEEGAGTWITPGMIAAYANLHAAGYAHSVEAWEAGELVGGLYGVSLGRCFFGESMFHLAPDASKAAMAALVGQLTRWGFHFIDCQMVTDHLLSLGALSVARNDFLTLLEDALALPDRRGTWELSPGVERMIGK
ncbi:MAG: leucyl/phenylalanyl-tRNA--protein transferase [Proteobacteria bacterium]|nr:leucyl/phenylalanyl-tRNA--protein transferase [Pseudomonadota bacterium]